MYMRKHSTLFLALVLGLVALGCDSNKNDDEISIAELIADGWIVTGASDANGDQMAVFAQAFNSIDVIFTQTGSFTLDVDAIDDEDDQTITGTYAVNESTNLITLTTTVPVVGSIGLNFTYSFNGDDEVTFTADQTTSTLLTLLLETPLQGSVSLTITRN